MYDRGKTDNRWSVPAHMNEKIGWQHEIARDQRVFQMYSCICIVTDKKLKHKLCTIHNWMSKLTRKTA